MGTTTLPLPAPRLSCAAAAGCGAAGSTQQQAAPAAVMPAPQAASPQLPAHHVLGVDQVEGPVRHHAAQTDQAFMQEIA